jgi:hypothetical protein
MVQDIIHCLTFIECANTKGHSICVNGCPASDVMILALRYVPNHLPSSLTSIFSHSLHQGTSKLYGVYKYGSTVYIHTEHW